MSAPVPKKSLGQHFLRQRSVVDKIVDAFGPEPGETVVEIGAGEGALTLVLAPRVAALHVIEIDERLVAQLLQQSEKFPNLVVHHADALRFDYCDVCPAGTRIRVIGNLPYNISTPLLFRLLTHAQCIDELWLMLQKEVAERVRAAPGNKDYGRLSVMVQQQCVVEPVLSVSPGAFFPRPQVESSVILLRPHRPTPYPISHVDRFNDIVRRAFSQRRKTLKNALRGAIDAAQIRAAGIDPNLRPEQVSVADYARLSRISP